MTRGLGAQGPGGTLRARSRSTPAGPVLGWTQGHAVDRSDPVAWALKLTLEQHARRMLQLWAPLLCWVMLARGDIDGFVGYRPGAIDLPAGSLIAAEAGFEILTLDGRRFDESVTDAAHRSFVAAHPSRINELLGLVRTAEAAQPGLRPLLGQHPVLVT
jgi:myo-inositol-1(or 4)-monophosphatase